MYGTMVASSILNLNKESGLQLLDQIFPRCLERIDKAVKKAVEYLRTSQLTGENLKEALNILHWAAKREQGTLRSISKLLPGDRDISSVIYNLDKEFAHNLNSSKKYIQSFYDDLCKKRGKKIESIALTIQEKSADRLIPSRNPDFPGPIDEGFITMKLGEKGLNYQHPFTRPQLYELGAFIDGDRSVLEIRNAVSAECSTVKLSDVIEYLKLLEAKDFCR